jgi:hypothetical protein
VRSQGGVLALVHWALNAKAVGAKGLLAALTSVKPGNPIVRLGKLVLLGGFSCGAFAARAALGLGRLLGVEARVGFAVSQAGHRLVFVPGSAHLSTAWPLVTALLLLFLGKAFAAVFCARAPAARQ